MIDGTAPPRTGEYLLEQLTPYPNSRVHQVARLLREYGYFPNDRFTPEQVRYYAAFVDDGNGRQR